MCMCEWIERVGALAGTGRCEVAIGRAREVGSERRTGAVTLTHELKGGNTSRTSRMQVPPAGLASEASAGGASFCTISITPLRIRADSPPKSKKHKIKNNNATVPCMNTLISHCITPMCHDQTPLSLAYFRLLKAVFTLYSSLFTSTRQANSASPPNTLHDPPGSAQGVLLVAAPDGTRARQRT